jgi:fructose-bisphosphate aldolase, class II
MDWVCLSSIFTFEKAKMINEPRSTIILILRFGDLTHEPLIMRISSKILFTGAYSRYAIGAFNIFNAEQALGVMLGAQKAELPVILQITPVARDYISHTILNGIIRAAEEIFPGVSFSVHLDHGNYEHCISAIQSGDYESVMIDASHKPFEENIQITREIVHRAHERGIAVEAELGVLSGIEDQVSVEEKKAMFTHPEQALEFIERTGCDSLAVAVGTSHGAYKFNGNTGLRLDVLEQIKRKLPGFPLVLHGASAVPFNEIERINQSGGQLRTEAKGTDPIELLQAIKLGVCKVNIATDIRLIWTRVHREFFQQEPEKFDLVIPGKTYMNELARFVAEKCLFLKGETKIVCDDQR